MMIQPGSKIFTMSDTSNETNTEWIAEADLAKRLNVDRAILKKMRPGLPAGSLSAAGKVVLWSHAAAAHAAVTLGLADDSLEKNAAPAPAERAAEEELTVIRNFPNPRVIQARRANGEAVMVRVSNGLKYVPKLRNGDPMKLRATFSTAHNCWVRTGRDPRFVGVW